MVRSDQLAQTHLVGDIVEDLTQTFLVAPARCGRHSEDPRLRVGVAHPLDDAAKFDEKGVQKAVSNIAELAAMLPSAIQKCLEYFAGVDRTLTGYEGLIAAQDCLPNDERRDAFASDFSVLSRIWEALSPDPVLTTHEKDYRWLAQVYESLKPSTGTGRLLWHRLGAKTSRIGHGSTNGWPPRLTISTKCF